MNELATHVKIKESIKQFNQLQSLVDGKLLPLRLCRAKKHQKLHQTFEALLDFSEVIQRHLIQFHVSDPFEELVEKGASHLDMPFQSLRDPNMALCIII